MARRAGSFGVRWFDLRLLTKATLFATAFEVGLRHKVDEFAQEVEDYAKENAPWQDRTGEARDGLTAEARHRLNHYYIDLFHTVDYGIWLEIRWNGQYAIIEPTLQVMGPRLMAELNMADLLVDLDD